MKEKLLEYVRENLEDWQMKQGLYNFERHEPIPYDLRDRISELCTEFSEENELDEEWWLGEFMDEEDVFLNL